MTLQATIRSGITGPYSRLRGIGNTSAELASTSPGLNISRTLGDGFGIAQGDIAFESSAGGRTILASANDDLDLSGIMADALGDNTVLVRVKAILISCEQYPLNPHTILVGNGPNPFLGPFGTAASTLKCEPGGWLGPLAHPGVTGNNGWVVTPGTGDILRLTNSGGTGPVTYDIIIVGGSA